MYTHKVTQISEKDIDTTVTLCGWCSKVHATKRMVFVWLTDDSFSKLKPIQLVFDTRTHPELEKSKKLTKDCSIQVTGKIVSSPGAQQSFEMDVSSLEIIGTVVDTFTYPMAKDDYEMDYYKSFPHLECHSKVKASIYEMRSALLYATHKFFRKQSFRKTHPPFITFSECESGCGVFTITSFGKHSQTVELPVKDKEGTTEIDYTKDFFGRKASLSVSTQLELECFMGLGPVWTEAFVARCEESATSRHLASFTMIELEEPFVSSAEQIMDRSEAYVKFCFSYVLEKSRPQLEFLSAHFGIDLVERLSSYLATPFPRIKHADAVTLMREQPEGTFEKLPEYHEDLGTEHEKWLTSHFPSGVFVTRYPKAVKAFYMPVIDQEHGVEHVDSFDFLIDGLELIGGSARIHKYEELESRIDELGLDRTPLEFYVELRKCGTAKSGGMGLGFDRLVKVVSGAPSVKDCVSFPRYFKCGK